MIEVRNISKQVKTLEGTSLFSMESVSAWKG